MTTATVQTSPTTDPLSRALARGVAAGLRVYRVAGREDLRFVTSQSEPGLGYLVTLDPDHGASCTCAGAAHGRACKHAALVLADQRPALAPVATEQAAVAPVVADTDRDAIRSRADRARWELFGD